MEYSFENGKRCCNGRPFFSVGVTTYDRISMLVETLSSILAQTFEDFEVIVGNDNPDRILSGEVLGINDSRVRFVNYPKNLGELGNMNSLLNISRGRYFTWIADDDLYVPNFLKTVYTSLIKYNFPVCVYTSFKRMNNNGTVNIQSDYDAQGRLLKGHEFLNLYLDGKIKAIGVMGVFDADYLKHLGGLEDVSDDRKGLFCEYMLIIKSAMLKNIVYINAPLVIYRTHEQSWGNSNTDLEAYKRAGDNLIRKSIEVIKLPEFRSSFFSNYYSILKLCMVSYGTVLRKSGELTLRRVLEYMVYAKKYVRLLRNDALYLIAIGSLFKAELRLVLSITWHQYDAIIPSYFKKLLLKK